MALTAETWTKEKVKNLIDENQHLEYQKQELYKWVKSLEEKECLYDDVKWDLDE